MRSRRNGNRKSSKTLNRKQQGQFVQVMGELLANGFSLQEALWLLHHIRLLPAPPLENAQKLLQEGHPLYDVLNQMGFDQEQLVQIELAETHGNLIETLHGLAEQFRLVDGFRKELKKLISYPLLLMLFLIGILISLRQIILPQLIGTNMVMEGHWGVHFIQSVHWYFFGMIGVASSVWGWMNKKLTKMDVIQKSEWISRKIGIGKVYALYQSAYLALEIGKLFYEGLELKQIIFCLQETKKGSLLQSLAVQMMDGLETGIPLAMQFQHYDFLTEEFSKIILQGEAKGNLGKELLFYSELTRKQFFQQISHWLHWLQPILFLGVAALILTIYAAILLPVYGNIEEVLK
ncbi:MULTISPECIES: competence type IV pilus assembly protein ComGB [unclassified Enterococcus]|uniref:competence type IV pilus assembly protein ComGB n=1 Tax=unclassified Enterococcus TaxID=2608891 RepID=UPI0013EE0238|nr:MULTISPECIES: competence type IV pilus assembly protein ComGB [unclassified Enterococcus]